MMKLSELLEDVKILRATMVISDPFLGRLVKNVTNKNAHPGERTLVLLHLAYCLTGYTETRSTLEPHDSDDLVSAPSKDVKTSLNKEGLL